VLRGVVQRKGRRRGIGIDQARDRPIGWRETRSQDVVPAADARHRPRQAIGDQRPLDAHGVGYGIDGWRRVQFVRKEELGLDLRSLRGFHTDTSSWSESRSTSGLCASR
jgi:hypothetical protein